MKKVLSIVICVALLGLAVSCGGSEEETAGSDNVITIGLSVDQLFESRVATNNGVKAEAEAQGIIVIEVVADGDPQTQNAQIESLITQQVDAILVCAVDQNTIETALMKADKAGIPIVAYDRALPDSNAADVFVGPDSIWDGEKCGEYVAASISSTEPVVILELLGALNDQNGIDRSLGFNKPLEGMSNVEIIQMPTDWSSDRALAATQNAFQANPDIAAVFAATDTQIPSIETVLTDLGKLNNVGEEGHVIVVGVNGSYDGYISVVNGTSDGITVMDCHNIGVNAVQLAMNLLASEPVQDIVVPGVFYTQENIEANKASIWGAK